MVGLKMRKNSQLIGFLKQRFRKISRFIDRLPKTKGEKFLSKDEEFNYYCMIYENSGLYTFLEKFSINNSQINNDKKALKILQIAKYIYDFNADKATRSNLAKLAFSLDNSPSTLKGVAWAGIHSTNYELAANAITKLSEIEPDNKADIDKLKSSLASRLSAVDIDNYLKIQYENIKSRVLVDDDVRLLVDQCYIYYKDGNDDNLSSYLYNVYLNSSDLNGLEVMLNHLWVAYQVPMNEYQRILINLGKKFSSENKKDLDCYWVEKAILAEKNTMAVRAAFWSYQRAGNIAKSKECLLWLAEYAEKNNDTKLQAFVDKRKNSYLFLTKKHITDLLIKADLFNADKFAPDKKTIAYILHNSLPFASGGYATRGHGLAVALSQKGYVVEVINRPGFPLDTKAELTEADIVKPDIIEGVRYSRIPYPRRDKLPTYEYLIQASEALYKRFLLLKPSIIVAASNHLTAIPAMIAARKLNLPFYYEVRGFWEVTRISREPEFEFTEWYKLLCDFEALVAQEADHVFTLTTPMIEELIKRGVEEDKITLLPNSCNPENFIPRERDQELAKRLSVPDSVPVIGYIGTFVQYEGLDHLAEACGLLKEKGIEFRLLIVGNENTAGTDRGPITQAILDIAKKYNFEKWLIMPGRIPHEEVESYYSLIDIAPFPRKPQPVTEMVSPMKPLEAAAMKKAIIASSVKALVDMINDEETGLIFQKGNIRDFSLKLELLLGSPDLRMKLGENARKWVETERTWNVTSNKMIDFLEL